MALKAGANTIMLINTPEKYRNSYRIYDNKNMVDLEAAIYAVNGAGIGEIILPPVQARDCRLYLMYRGQPPILFTRP